MSVPFSWWSIATVAVILYLIVELFFAVAFYCYLIPRANQRTPPIPYRDYERQRHKLLLRIIDRLEQTARTSRRNVRAVIRDYLTEWFEQQTPPPLVPCSNSNVSSSSSSSCTETSSIHSDSSEEETCWTVEGLGRDEVDEFFSWAFFGKHVYDLESWEVQELQKCYQQIEARFGLVFEHGKLHRYRPRLLTLENVSPLHRPLAVYALVLLTQRLAGLLLRLLGFQRVLSSTGLIGWYRQARRGSECYLPMLFFHGIAPAGFAFYLPMVFHLVQDGRAVFLFQNQSISCTVGFDALTEQDTVEGVKEIVGRFEPNRKLSLVGHSFGSCQLTWLLHSTLQSCIAQMVLVDPVSILLSEPDVMVNFLYTHDVSKIRMFASSELFTEYYLRRHFSWYNSELWLHDVPEHVRLLVALSGIDEIVNAPKVRHELETNSFPVLHWEGATHAKCVTNPRNWKELKTRMLQQELELFA